MCPSKNISWFFLINIVLLINIKQAICQKNKNVKVYYNQENIDNLILANKYDSAMRCLKNNIDNFKELKLSNKQLGQNFLTRGKLGVLTQIDSLTLSDLNNADSLLKNQVRASEDYIICLLNKALYFEKTFNISQAKYNYELFFNLLPTIYSKTSLQYAGYISYYAEFLKKNLEYSQSELLLWDALKIYKDSLDNKHEYIARILGTLGSVKALQNDRSSINLFLQALEILNSNKNIPIFYDEKARIINNLANVYSEIGSLEQADSCFNAVIDFFNQNINIDETKFGISLFNYSNFLEQNGNYESSIEILMHALAIFQNIKAKEYIIPIKIKLANCYFETKNKENSIKHLNEVLGDSLLQKISVQSLPIRLNNIANIFSKLQNYLMADSIFTVALKLMEGSKNFNKLNKLRTISNLANCKFNLNQFKIADSLYTIACREKGKILIKNTDSYLESLFGYVQNKYHLEDRLNDFGEIKELLQIREKLTYSFQQFNSDYNYVLYKNKLNKCLNLAYSICEQNNDSTLILEAFRASQISENNTLSQSIKRQNFIKNQSLEIQEANDLLLKYNRIFYNKNMSSNINQNEIKQINDSINKYEKKLNKLTNYSILTESPSNFESLKLNLLKNESIIKFINYNHFNKISKQANEIHYSAFIISSHSKIPTFVYLFSETDWHKIIKKYKNDGELDNGFLAYNDLYSLIWKKLEKHLTNTDRIYLSTSGLLNQINFNALNIDKRNFLDNRHTIIQTNNISNINHKPPSLNQNTNVLILGDINYDLDTLVKLANGLDTLNNIKVNESNLLNKNDISFLLNRGINYKWQQLEGTKIEAQNVKQIMERNNIPLNFLSASEASEENTKQIICTNKPTIIHFSTHGYFFPDSQTNNTENKEKSDYIFQFSNYPMLRSGLILAGANYAWLNHKPYKYHEDGILTAHEISLLDLSNTELVVLSACNSGLGDIKGNEGVYGLQRAFKIAGVKYIMMSLWAVPDKTTQELMTLFYNNWIIKKMEIHEALSQAQKELRKYYPNPYYWASFIITQ